MWKINSISVHYFFRSIILFGFISFIIYLFKTESLVYYIAPRMMIYLKIGVLGLYIVAVFQITLAIRSLKHNKLACDCEHIKSRSLPKNVLIYVLFILPILFGFMLPNSSMTSSLAAKKGINLMEV